MTELIGILGALILLILFVFNQLGKLKQDDFSYNMWNMIGGGLLAVYAVLIGSIPFAILNGVWMLASLRDVVKYFRK